jgi:hypothetical protein
MVDFFFYRFERPLVAFCFFYLFWAFSPPPAPLPVADQHGVLARFEDSTQIGGVARPFFFGLATAPAHVEDKARWPVAYALRPRSPHPHPQLDDGWLDFARAGKVSAFLNQERPEVRNDFWSKPEVEIDIAASAGVQARPSRAICAAPRVVGLQGTAVCRRCV